MLFKINEILDAPCIFCGYNGPNYWQPHTHNKSCPFFEIGGDREREHALVVFARKGLLTYNKAIHADGEKRGIMVPDGPHNNKPENVSYTK